MRVVLLNGSPQKKGNTFTLLDEASKVAATLGVEAHLVHVPETLKDAPTPFCNQCSVPCEGSCSRNNRLGDAFELLRGADAVLIGSPVYFGTVSAQLKAFWDKTRVLRRDKALLNVIGGAVSVGSSRFGGQESTLLSIYQMMLVQGMTLIGDGFVEVDCGHLGAASQKPAQDDLHGLERVRVVMRRLIEVAAATQHLRQRPVK
ncbi:MAG: flavodoxin family protein [Bacillota bacterium]